MNKVTLVFEEMSDGGIRVTMHAKDIDERTKVYKYARQCFHSFSQHIKARTAKRVAKQRKAKA